MTVTQRAIVFTISAAIIVYSAEGFVRFVSWMFRKKPSFSVNLHWQFVFGIGYHKPKPALALRRKLLAVWIGPFTLQWEWIKELPPDHVKVYEDGTTEETW